MLLPWSTCVVPLLRDLWFGHCGLELSAEPLAGKSETDRGGVVEGITEDSLDNFFWKIENGGFVVHEVSAVLLGLCEHFLDMSQSCCIPPWWI